MALENFKHLAMNLMPDFENPPIALLRFKLNSNKTLDLSFQDYMWLWNRHYWEHSFAFQHDNFTLNLSEFLTLKAFVFTNDTGDYYFFKDYAALILSWLSPTTGFGFIT